MARGGIAIDRPLTVGPWVRSELTGAIHDMAVRSGYRPLSVALDRASFARSLRPRWATVTAIVTAPTLFGLLFLLVRTSESFTAIVREDHTGISVRIHGRVDRSLMDELTKLTSSGPARLAPAPSPTSVGAPNHLAAPPLPVASPLAGVAPPPVPFAAPAGQRLIGGEPSIVLPGSSPPSWSPASAPVPPVYLAPAAHAPTPPLHAAPAFASVQTPASAPASPPASPSPWLLSEPNGYGDANGSTQVVARPAVAGVPVAPAGPVLTMRLADGSTFDVTGVALMGRNPSPGEHDDHPRLVVVNDDTVSKTHLAVGVTDGIAWVADRYSTNGSMLVDHDGREIRLEPGQRIRVDAGCAVRLGGYWAKIERFS